MDIRHLKCFVVVAEELHFGRAAARLHTAQPAVSQTVIGLERELGLVLFERTNRRVELTDAGRALLGEARGVLDRFDGTVALAERLRSGATGRVSVAVTPALPPNLLTELLAVFRAAAPDVKVVAKSVGDVPDPLAGLGGRFDLAILRGQVHAPGIASVVVVTEPVGVALPACHRLASSESVSARSLAGEPLAAFPRASAPAEFDRIFAVLAAAGLDDVGVIHESPPGAVGRVASVGRRRRGAVAQAAQRGRCLRVGGRGVGALRRRRPVGGRVGGVAVRCHLAGHPPAGRCPLEVAQPAIIRRASRCIVIASWTAGMRRCLLPP